MAFVLSLETLTSSFFNLIGGVLADRISKKKLLVVTDIISGIGCLILSFFVNDSLIGIYLITFINLILAVTYSIYSPAVKSIVSEVLNEKEIPKTNALINGIGEVLKVVGPLLGVISISILGVQGAFLINAISFLLSALLQALLITKYIKADNLEVKKGIKNILLIDLLEGWRYIKSQKQLLYILLLASVSNFFLSGYLLLLPFFANNTTNGASLYGQSLTTQAIGGIIAAVVYYRLDLKLSPTTIGFYLMVSGVGVGLLGICSLADWNSYLTLVFTGLYGLGITLFNIQFVTYIQQNTDRNFIGRVFSFIFTIAILFIPVGNFFYGWLYELIIDWCFIIVAFGILFTATVYTFIIKQYR